jgi:hypothetical protein
MLFRRSLPCNTKNTDFEWNRGDVKIGFFAAELLACRLVAEHRDEGSVSPKKGRFRGVFNKVILEIT